MNKTHLLLLGIIVLASEVTLSSHPVYFGLDGTVRRKSAAVAELLPWKAPDARLFLVDERIDYLGDGAYSVTRSIRNTSGDTVRFKDEIRVLDAFRAKNFTVGTYFSKPDWHSQLYWWDTYGKKGRNVNYPIKQHPERWQKFVKYTHNQIEELMTNYGKVDILWLDGGWVAAENRGQDIDMPGMARMARSHQPGLIIVDRTIHGPYENYQTPERTIPEEQLPYPWESCIPLSDDWGFVNRPRWKSPQRVVNTLVEIVAKGGNLVLGVGPTPEGLIQPEAVSRLKSIGQWLKKYGHAIYSTTTTPRYHDGSLWFTAAKDGSALYAIYTLAEEQPMPTEVTWTGNVPAKGVRLLSTGKKLKTKVVGDQVTVTLPKQMPQESFALELRMK
jgi:alpha-L-fucosidase